MIRAVAVCGLICSGKSSLVACLSERYGWSVVSFGDYVRHIALTTDRRITRDGLQRLGNALLTNRGVSSFLQDVVQFSSPNSDTHLFDGVRHLPVANAIRQAYYSSLVIYLDASVDQRYRRFKGRARSEDLTLTVDEFLELESHVTEKGVREIAKSADLLIDASIPQEQLLASVYMRLDAW